MINWFKKKDVENVDHLLVEQQKIIDGLVYSIGLMEKDRANTNAEYRKLITAMLLKHGDITIPDDLIREVIAKNVDFNLTRNDNSYLIKLISLTPEKQNG